MAWRKTHDDVMGWQYVHIVPTRDTIQHVKVMTRCPCMPFVERHPGGTMVSHNAASLELAEEPMPAGDDWAPVP